MNNQGTALDSFTLIESTFEEEACYDLGTLVGSTQALAA